jgi:LPXTG-motif cell wall-anchored protein
MRVLRAVLFPLLAAGSLTVPGAGQAGAEDSHPGGLPETCPEVLSGAPSGDLEKRTDPPEGSDVQGGDVITVTLRWNPQSFDGPLLHKAIDCVTVNGEIAADLSGQERDAPNDGLFEWRYTVPADVPAGARICDRGFVSGPGSGGIFEREKSNDVCFTVAAPVITPAPNGPAPGGSAPSGSGPSGSGPSGSGPGDSGPSGSTPSGSAPTSPAPGPTPSSATPSAPGTPETKSPTAGPRPTGGGSPGADEAPPVAVLASPPSAPLSPEVKFDTALPATGATATPLVLAGMTVCAGGACVMAGARRRRRSHAG